LTILFWLGLSAAGSTLLLATTNIITQDIAVSPFLWIAPLSLYLLTFVLAFESDRRYPRLVVAVAAGILAPAACAVVNAGVGLSLLAQLGVYLAALFAVCMLTRRIALCAAFGPTPDRLLPDDCRRGRAGRRLRSAARSTLVYRIQ
jgi:hypothetical protein